MPTTSAKPLPKNGPEPSFRTIPRARSNILSTLTSTLNDISSNAASASSSSSDAWQHATRRRRRIISPSSSSPPPCYGSAKCPQDLRLPPVTRRRPPAGRYPWPGPRDRCDGALPQLGCRSEQRQRCQDDRQWRQPDETRAV